MEMPNTRHNARYRQRMKEEFEQCERQRLGLSPRTQEPTRKAPIRADDRQVKDLIARGYSPETAAAMLEGLVPSPHRYAAGGSWIID